MPPVEAIGVILQLVGGVITVFGLWETKNALFPGERRLTRLWRQVKGQAFRLVGRRGRDVRVVAGTISANVSMSGSAYGYVSPGPDASLEDRIRALEGRVEVLDAMRVDEVKRLAGDRARADQIERRVADVEQSVPVLIGGERGSGLTVAAAGVLVSLLGTLLSALG